MVWMPWVLFHTTARGHACFPEFPLREVLHSTLPMQLRALDWFVTKEGMKNKVGKCSLTELI